MKRMLTGMAAGVAVVVIVTVAVAAQQSGAGQPGQGMPRGVGQVGPGGRGPGGPGGGLGRVTLTDEQREQVRKIVDQARSKRQAEAASLKELQDKLRDAIFADAGPTGDAQGIARQINQLQATMMESHVAEQEAIAKILTPEQRKTMREMPSGPGRMAPGRGMTGPGRGMTGPGRGMTGPGRGGMRGPGL